MRRRLLTLLCTALAVLAPRAGAQPKRPAPSPAPKVAPPPPAAKAAEAAEDDDDEEEEAEPAQPQAGGETQPIPVQDGAAPSEVHTVVRGDTLWDLSQRYLGNPWYWPKVWSYNPDIANPHWIYPGNRVRLFGQGEEVPTEVEPGSDGAVSDGQPGQAALNAPPSDAIPPEVAPPVQVMGKLTYTPPKAGVHLLREAFVTTRELDESGVIDSSFAESEMLSYPETVYIRFKNRRDIHVGDRYLVFHTETEVKHPVTGSRFGYLTRILGTVRVVSISDPLVTAQIVDTYDAIYRSDLIGPFGERLDEVIAPRPNERALKGYVMGSVTPNEDIMGEQHRILVDKGSADGVQPGNTFTVVRQGNLGGDFINPAKTVDPRLPLEDIGTCMAVDVKDRATTCLVTRSLRELVPGDRVEMRVASPAPGPVSQR